MGSLMGTMALGFFVGILGTVIGGLSVLLFPDREPKQQSMMLGMSGGIMVAVVLWDLWPEALATHGYSAVSGGLLGLVFIVVAGMAVRSRSMLKMNSFARTGLLMGIGIGVHNFPEGLAIGTVKAAAVDWRRWLSLAGMMTAHNVPEGMVVAAALRLAKVSLRQVVLALFLVELPMAIGALMGGVLGQISHRFVAASLGFASGAMVLLVLKEMLPMGNDLSSAGQTFLGLGSGLLIGLLLTHLL